MSTIAGFTAQEIEEDRNRYIRAIQENLLPDSGLMGNRQPPGAGGFKREPAKHSHYFKSVAHLAQVDVYRVLELFGVTNPSIAHATKKLLVAGGRGAGKSIDKDIQEAIDSLVRWQAMRNEDRHQDDLR